MNNTVMNKSSNVEDTDNKEIEAIRDSLKKRPDGSPRQTIENVIEVLNKDPMLKDAIRRNELSCKTDIVKKMDWRRRSKTFTDTDFNNIMLSFMFIMIFVGSSALVTPIQQSIVSKLAKDNYGEIMGIQGSYKAIGMIVGNP